MALQFKINQDLRSESESIKNEVLKMKDIYAEEFFHFGKRCSSLVNTDFCILTISLLSLTFCGIDFDQA